MARQHPTARMEPEQSPWDGKQVADMGTMTRAPRCNHNSGTETEMVTSKWTNRLAEL